ncbi:restriction endonuclease subunit S [Azonexus sp. IMCC34839]|uniref:restriction endonuclease subunit S n=1 Tax=Azonexus sp. IMCC34839 TaxID=3133695 RepID=UPI00399BCB7C
MNRVRLGDLCQIRSGGTPSREVPDYYGGEIPWAKIDDLNVQSGVVNKTAEGITPKGLNAIRGRLFPAGTLLFAMYGSVGKIAWAGCEMSTNQAILGIEVEDTEILDRGYLFRWLQSQRPRFESEASGVTQKNLSAGYIRDQNIPLLPIDVQRRIAAILDKADAIHKKRRESLALANESVRSSFLQLLGNSLGERVSVQELLPATSNAIRTGPFGSQLLHSEFTEKGIPVLGIDNVVTNRFRWAERRYVSHEKYKELRRYRVFPGDVMVTIMGTTGRVCIAPENLPECISTKHLCTITLDRQRLLPEYLWASLLWDPVVRAQATREGKGAIMEGWNMGLVRGLMIKVPPLSQQEHFSAFVRNAEGLRTKLQAADVESNQLFGTLAQRAFSGQL